MVSHALLSGGYPPEKDYFFAEKPENPEMRESTSMWLFEESGAFGFPRFGIEAEAHRWENRMVQGNFAFADGRVLLGAQDGAAHSPIGPTGKPDTLGAGPLSFRCIEPFKKWLTVWDGTAIDGTIEQMIKGGLDTAKRVPVRFEIEVEIVGPGWIQDYTPEALAKMTEAERAEVAYMGIGWRVEQAVRASGVLTLDGRKHDFKAAGIRVKRQSVRPMSGFRGHCWQAAVFPDGSSFAYVAYPPKAGEAAYNEGYVFKDGKMAAARAVEIPWLKRVIPAGDDVPVVLETELGTFRISATTALNTFTVGNPHMFGLNLHQGGARYQWGDQVAYGMIERSSYDNDAA